MSTAELAATVTAERVCETAVHTELKRDASWWASLPLLGLTDLGDGELLEMRNCGCGSTLVRIVSANEVTDGTEKKF